MDNLQFGCQSGRHFAQALVLCFFKSDQVGRACNMIIMDSGDIGTCLALDTVRSVQHGNIAISSDFTHFTAAAALR